MSQQAIILQHIERIAKVGHFFSSVKTYPDTPQLGKYTSRQLWYWSILYRTAAEPLASFNLLPWNTPNGRQLGVIVRQVFVQDHLPAKLAHQQLRCWWAR